MDPAGTHMHIPLVLAGGPQLSPLGRGSTRPSGRSWRAAWPRMSKWRPTPSNVLPPEASGPDGGGEHCRRSNHGCAASWRRPMAFRRRPRRPVRATRRRPEAAVAASERLRPAASTPERATRDADETDLPTLRRRHRLRRQRLWQQSAVPRVLLRGRHTGRTLRGPAPSSATSSSANASAPAAWAPSTAPSKSRCSAPPR